jgi:hypothetical protein
VGSEAVIAAEADKTAEDTTALEPTAAPAESPVELTPAARAAILSVVEGLIDNLDCARINASLTRDRTFKLRGYLGSEEDLGELRNRLLELEQVAQVNDSGVEVHVWRSAG